MSDEQRLATLEAECVQLTQERDALKAELSTAKIRSLLAESKSVVERCALPPTFVASVLAPHFKLEAGTVTGYEDSGKEIWSRRNPGTRATFDEAVEILLERHPNKKFLLKASSDEKRDGDLTSLAKQVLTRKQFSQVPHPQRGKLLQKWR